MKIDSISAPANVPTDFSEYAERFVSDHAARVYMRMPGCHEVFVNSAHRRAFPAKFLTVTTTEDTLIALQEDFDENEDSLWDRPCYCYPMGAIVALIGRHCVFERSLHAMENEEPKRTSHEDIAAFLVNQDERRTYQLYVTVSQCIRNEKPMYLNAELSRIIGLQVVVKTETASADIAEIVCAQTTLNGEDFLAPIRRDIRSQGGYGGYVAVSNAIRKAVTDLSEAKGERRLAPVKQLLIDTIRKNRGEVDYEAVVGFLNGIFAGTETRLTERRRISEIAFELNEINKRLFDAFVVVDEVAKKVAARIQEWQQ